MQEILNTENRQITVSSSFFAYLAFTVAVLLNDYIAFFIPRIEYIIGLFIAATIVLFISIFLFRHRLLGFYDRDINEKKWVHTAGVLLIVLFTLLKIALPEKSYDVFNYHLYFQQLFNRDFLNFDFFPIRAVNAHYCILGDRMCYVFRFLLGYRLGTLINTFCIIVLYIGLADFVREAFEVKNETAIMIAVTAGLITENIIWEYSSYLVDVLALPFLLELMVQVLIKKRSNAIYLCLLAGLSISLKTSNAFLIIPLAMYYLVTQRKELKAIEVIGGVFCAAATLGVYLFVFYRLTGNPLFPYANSIFQSPYFSLTESPNSYVLTTRFGPESFWQYVLWPVYEIILQDRSSDIHFNTGRLLFSILSFIFYLAIKRGKLSQKETTLCIYWVYMYLVRLFFAEGYSRYVILMDVLGGVYAMLIIFAAFKSNEFTRQRYAVATVLFLVFCFQTGLLVKQYLVNDVEWSWRGNIIKSPKEYYINAKYFFGDYSRGKQASLIGKEIEEWFAVDYDGSVAVLLDSSVPIVGLKMTATNEYTTELLKNRISDVEKKNVYTYAMVTNMEDCLAALAMHDLCIEELETIETDFMNPYAPLTLIKLANRRSPVTYECYSTLKNTDITKIKSSNNHVKGFVGFAPIASGWGSDGFVITIAVVDRDGNHIETVSESYCLPKETWTEFQIPVEYCTGEYDLALSFRNLEGNDDIADWYEMVLCYEELL